MTPTQANGLVNDLRYMASLTTSQTRNTSTIYGEFLPAFNGRRIQLLDIPRLIGQLVGLERRVARGGRDSIGHQPGSHDDVANAACGALVQVLSDRRPALVRKSDLLNEDGALPLPRKVRYVFAVVAVDEKTGSIAVIYAAKNMPGLLPELLLLDFDVSPLRGDIFPIDIGTDARACFDVSRERLFDNGSQTTASERNRRDR